MKTIWRIPIVSLLFLLLVMLVACAAPVPAAPPAQEAPAQSQDVPEATEAPVVGHSVFLEFNLGVKELQDVRVREAIFRAIDRNQLVADMFGDSAQVATSPFSPALRQELAISPTPVAIWSYDISQGEKLLKEAGFADGFTVNLYYPTGEADFGEAESLAKGIADNLNGIGITVSLQGLPQDKFWGKRRAGELQGLYLVLAELRSDDPLWVESCPQSCTTPPPNSYQESLAPTGANGASKLQDVAGQYIGDWGRVWIADLIEQ